MPVILRISKLYKRIFSFTKSSLINEIKVLTDAGACEQSGATGSCSKCYTNTRTTRWKSITLSSRNILQPYRSIWYRYFLSKCYSIKLVAGQKKKSRNPLVCGFQDLWLLFKLLGGEIYLSVSWYTFMHFILHIHLILHLCVPRLKFLEPKWSHIYS